MQLHTDHTLLSELQLPSYNPIQSTQDSQFHITGVAALVDGRYERDLPDPAGQPN